jgi:hypothetical protein
MTTRALKTTRIAAVALAATAIAAPTALIAAGSYNTRADVRTMPVKQIRATSARIGAMVAPNGVAVRVNLKITGRGRTMTKTLGLVAARVPLKTMYMNVSGLKRNTTYRVQAVAINGGRKTSPGTTVSFKTKR